MGVEPSAPGRCFNPTGCKFGSFFRQKQWPALPHLSDFTRSPFSIYCQQLPVTSIPPFISVDLNVLLGLILWCIRWISHLAFTGSMTGALYTAQILHNSSGIHCWSEVEVVSFSDGLTLFCTVSQLVHHVDSFWNIWVVSLPNLTHSLCILLKTIQFLPMNHYDPPTVLLSENAPSAARPRPPLMSPGTMLSEADCPWQGPSEQVKGKKTKPVWPRTTQLTKPISCVIPKKLLHAPLLFSANKMYFLVQMSN